MLRCASRMSVVSSRTRGFAAGPSDGPSDSVASVRAQSKNAAIGLSEKKCFYFSQTGMTNAVGANLKNSGQPYWVNHLWSVGGDSAQFSGVSMLSSITRGTSANQRIGNKIRVHAMHFKVRITPATQIGAEPQVGQTYTSYVYGANRPNGTTSRILVLKDTSVQAELLGKFPVYREPVQSFGKPQYDTSAIRDVNQKLFSFLVFPQSQVPGGVTIPYDSQIGHIQEFQPIPGAALSSMRNYGFLFRQPNPDYLDRFMFLKDITVKHASRFTTAASSLVLTTGLVNDNNQPMMVDDSDGTIDFSLYFGPSGEVYDYYDDSTSAQGDYGDRYPPALVRRGTTLEIGTQYFESAGYNNNMAGKDVLFLLGHSYERAWGQMTCNIIFTDA